MIWPGDSGISGDDPRTWDPSDNSLTNLAKPGYDLFCVGIAVTVGVMVGVLAGVIVRSG